MVGHGLVMFGWSWIEVSILGILVFGEASAESCDTETAHKCLSNTFIRRKLSSII